ncbi:MAG: hypothetical protein AABZ60_20660 [Planctomycetota bacterium]
MNLNLDQEKWIFFEKVCAQEGKSPDRVLEHFIHEYAIKHSKEYQIAQSMVEAKKILKGEVSGKDAYELLKEL